ncbi:hypothetical protein AVEN_185038-1 [Araneus ventricosus]|uniref:Uncharacterized protein n=1 Tax=Araneus ventricosus TaxID=182803 RepID=A0A4Y2BPT7_ARAVE|nr:hypothetical protein AVEN_185038-1 [Araneus ventricosus]
MVLCENSVGNLKMFELMFVMRMDKVASMSLVKALFSELPKWFQRETEMTSPFRELIEMSLRTALLNRALGPLSMAGLIESPTKCEIHGVIRFLQT